MEQNYNYNGYNGGYDNNNNNNNNNNGNYSYDNGSYVYAQPVMPQQAPRKKNKFAKAVALVAAVAVIGAGTGFWGAYLANRVIGTDSGGAASSSEGSPAPASTSGTRNTDPSVSSAIAAISESGSGDTTAAKVSASSVVPTGVNGQYTLPELYEAVNDTIVLVKVYQDSAESYDYYDYFFGYGGDSGSGSSEPVYTGYGSGIVFTEDGYILTNAHVVEGATKLVVEVNDYTDPDVTHEYEAKVIGSDTPTDIAVIKIERDEPFLAAKIGDSSSLRVGEQVAIIGNPGVTADIMFAHTMTTGIVSGLDVECLNESGYSISLIQTDAAINSGNSGGGMFDMYGRVVGVVNSKIVVTTYEGIGFALTIDEAKPIMEDLLTYGYVKSRPVLGISTIPLNEYRARAYGTKLSKGMLVASLNKGAPVEKSGLSVGDIITKVNGTNVASLKDVQTILSKFKVGDTVTVTVARENGLGGVDSIDIDIELTESTKE
ncbi:MAG: trypsin-like peptidase domain-containing protein [Ruminiclostridium sp.]|nr:trypsin-like peptidase domain-containing protein [Ruminiclostridium sp.]